MSLPAPRQRCGRFPSPGCVEAGCRLPSGSVAPISAADHGIPSSGLRRRSNQDRGVGHRAAGAIGQPYRIVGVITAFLAHRVGHRALSRVGGAMNRAPFRHRFGSELPGPGRPDAAYLRDRARSDRGQLPPRRLIRRRSKPFPINSLKVRSVAQPRGSSPRRRPLSPSGVLEPAGTSDASS